MVKQLIVISGSKSDKKEVKPAKRVNESTADKTQLKT